MQVHYDEKHDLLYLRFDPRPQEVRNEDASEGIVIDRGDGDLIVGIEILDASRRLNLDALFPLEFRKSSA